MKKVLFAALTLMFIGSCSKKDSTPATPVPTVSFTWSPTTSTAPATITFVNNSTNASSYSWDFGDGRTSTDANPSHTYTTGNTFLVKLTATGAGGSANATNSITILKPTELKITVLDVSTNVVAGAQVKLFATLSDWQNGTNQVGSTLTSNSSGVVMFTNLQPSKYYWAISKSCQNNYNTTYTTTGSLTANTVNTVNSQVISTGTLVFTNTSSNPYKVELNGNVLYSSMTGGTSNIYSYAPTGNYTIKVTQLSGFIIPTIKTYTGTLSCGSTLTTTFP